MATDAHGDDVVDQRSGLVDGIVAQVALEGADDVAVEHDLGETDGLGAVHETEGEQGVGAGKRARERREHPLGAGLLVSRLGVARHGAGGHR